MIDGIIKADGTSRLMRANLPATYEEFKTQAASGALPLDVLFNAEGWSQIPTFLNKANLLKDGTAELFGLGADSVPNDVFSWIVKYNTHWWSALYDQGGIGYKEAKTNVTNDIWITEQLGTGSHTFSYSKEITINQSTGAVSLKNPTQITIDGTYASIDSVNAKLGNLVAMAPVYITNLVKNPSGIYCLPSGSKYNPDATYGTISRYRNDNGFYYIIGTQTNGAPVAQLVTSQMYNIPPGEKVYINSADRNAYPDNGEVSGVLYQYLGVPFQNAVTAPKIATGSYTGTGKYGASNPNSITFDFEPKLVFLVAVDIGGVIEQTNGTQETRIPFHLLSEQYTRYFGFCTSNSYRNKSYAKRSGNTMYWYNGQGSTVQYNEAGYEYHWVAIG